MDIFLAAAGAVAFRAYRIVGWMIAHPVSLLVILGLFLGLATGLWYSAVVLLVFAPLIYGRRELRSNRYRRALERRGVESAPPPPGDLPAAPVVAAVILVAFAALISLPQGWLTVALRTVIGLWQPRSSSGGRPGTSSSDAKGRSSTNSPTRCHLANGVRLVPQGGS